MVAHPTDDGLYAELQHRARTTLATTRALVRRSAETSQSLEDYVAHLDGRLAALARVQSAAISDPLSGIDLGLLVADEIASAGLGNSDHISIEGVDLLLHPRAAEPFALALHELMTNAIKYGALSMPGGRLAVTWQVEPRGTEPDQLVFKWAESRIGLVKEESRRKGFGTVVLQEMLKHNLGAETEMAFNPGGLVCLTRLPLGERVWLPRKSAPDESN